VLRAVEAAQLIVLLVQHLYFAAISQETSVLLTFQTVLAVLFVTLAQALAAAVQNLGAEILTSVADLAVLYSIHAIQTAHVQHRLT
jgi:hypothetical protein